MVGRSSLGKAFLDCGAFSVYNNRSTAINVNKYASWCIRNQNKFSHICVPDVIGDPVLTEKNTYEFINLIDGRIPLDKILSVYHVLTYDIGAYRRVLEYSNELGLSFVGIGGGVGLQISERDLFLFIDLLNKYIDRKVFRLHLFGVARPKLILRILPDSSDAAVWEMSATGTYHKYIYEDNLLNTYRTSHDSLIIDRDIRTDVLIDELFEVIQYFPYTNLPSYEELRFLFSGISYTELILLINLGHFLKFQHVLRTNFIPNFRFYSTLRLDIVKIPSNLVDSLILSFFRHNSLVSYTHIYRGNQYGFSSAAESLLECLGQLEGINEASRT